jgi:hypothetical protein
MAARRWNTAAALFFALGASVAMAQEIDFAQPGAGQAGTPGGAAPGTPPAPAPQDTGDGPAPAAPPPVEQVPLDQPAESGAPAEAQAPPTLERFQQALSPYGRWVSTPEYGMVWTPTNMPPTWRPYGHGRWVYTRHGWTFVSYDPWGWAPFHYGRWLYYPRTGWAWIPGYKWAPAWVSWRYGGDTMAWAPLGPTGVAVTYYNTPSLWMAVRGPHFYRPLLPSYFIPTLHITRVFRTTYYAGVPRVGFYFSPPVRYVSRYVVRAPVVRFSARTVAPRWVARGVYRPHVRLARAIRSAPVVSAPRSYRGAIGRPLTAPARASFQARARPSTYRAPAARPGGFRGPAARPSGFRGPAARPGGFRGPAARPGGFRAPAARPGGFRAPAARPGGFRAPAARPGGFRAPAPRPGVRPGTAVRPSAPTKRWTPPSRPSGSTPRTPRRR